MTFAWWLALTLMPATALTTYPVDGLYFTNVAVGGVTELGVEMRAGPLVARAAAQPAWWWKPSAPFSAFPHRLTGWAEIGIQLGDNAEFGFSHASTHPIVRLAYWRHEVLPTFESGYNAVYLRIDSR